MSFGVVMKNTRFLDTRSIGGEEKPPFRYANQLSFNYFKLGNLRERERERVEKTVNAASKALPRTRVPLPISFGAIRESRLLASLIARFGDFLLGKSRDVARRRAYDLRPNSLLPEDFCSWR